MTPAELLPPRAAASSAPLDRQPPVRMLLRVGMLAAMFALIGLSALLFARRISGHLIAPLPAPAIFAFAVATVLTAAGWRWAWRRVNANPPLATELAAQSVPTVVALLLIAAVSLPGSSTAALAIAWLLVVTTECAWLCAFGRKLLGEQSTARQAIPAHRSTRQLESGEEAEEEEDEEDAQDEFPEHLMQQITRERIGDGGERVSGWTRGRFDQGERQLNLHVAFCPPFANRPLVEFHQVAGPSATVRAAQIETFGVRFDVRLNGTPRGGDELVVAFEASSRNNPTANEQSAYERSADEQTADEQVSD